MHSAAMTAAERVVLGEDGEGVKEAAGTAGGRVGAAWSWTSFWVWVSLVRGAGAGACVGAEVVSRIRLGWGALDRSLSWDCAGISLR